MLAEGEPGERGGVEGMGGIEGGQAVGDVRTGGAFLILPYPSIPVLCSPMTMQWPRASSCLANISTVGT